MPKEYKKKKTKKENERINGNIYVGGVGVCKLKLSIDRNQECQIIIFLKISSL